jgi:hypothetical protein
LLWNPARPATRRSSTANSTAVDRQSRAMPAGLPAAAKLGLEVC